MATRVSKPNPGEEVCSECKGLGEPCKLCDGGGGGRSPNMGMTLWVLKIREEYDSTTPLASPGTIAKVIAG